MGESETNQSTAEAPLVAVIMGSTSDWERMRHAAEVLKEYRVRQRFVNFEAIALERAVNS